MPGAIALLLQECPAGVALGQRVAFFQHREAEDLAKCRKVLDDGLPAFNVIGESRRRHLRIVIRGMRKRVIADEMPGAAPAL